MTRATLFIALTACSGGDEQTPVAAPPVLRALEVRGAVTQNGAPLHSGAVLASDAPIEVGDGRAVIEVAGGGTVRLYRHTTVRVRREEEQGTTVKLVAGKLWAIVMPQREGRRFEVHTDNAVAGVRGTELVVETAGEETSVGVVTGEVEVDGGGEVVRVKPNQARKVRRGGKAETTAYDPARDRNVWNDLQHAFNEVKELVKEGAGIVKDVVKENAPKVEEKIKEEAPKTPRQRPLRSGAEGTP
jgi:ferric-dicitrate binding protein FerR (iron transport regulator)